MARPRFQAAELDEILVAIASMDRDELAEQFHAYPAPFPIDFNRAFLETQPLEKLRHIFARLVMHCRIAPRTFARAS